jgi:hypothetical protein
LTLPTEDLAKSKIVWSSRSIQHWYEADKLHVFLMIDGFRVEQGGWTLTARDGVVWMDESQMGAGKPVVLGIYAEDGVTVQAPGGEAVKADSLYVTLRTSGDVERLAAPDQDIEKNGAGKPLYLRAKKLRTDTLAGSGAKQGDVAKAPEPAKEPAATDTTKTAEPPTAATPPDDKPKKVTRDIVVRPLHDKDLVPGAQVTSYEDPENPKQRMVTIWTGGVAVTADDIEMKADNVVIWTNNKDTQGETDPVTGDKRGTQAEVYLEGNVVITWGGWTLRANKAYYDLDNDRALIEDAVIHGFSSARNVPVYYSAAKVRQLARDKFVADAAVFSTNEMAVPATALKGNRFEFTNLTERDPETQEDVRRIRYRAEDVVSTIRDMPVTWWPVSGGDITQGETALRRIQMSHRDNRGTGLETQWHLWKMLGLYREPQGFKKTYLDLNLYSERGPQVGVRSRYFRDDFFGNFLATFVDDHGKDSIGDDDQEPPRHERGRLKWQHRQFLPDDWQVTMELSYLSDAGFLREWYEKEFYQEKDQETLLHVKKQWDNQMVSILAKGRINDFQTETESMPRVEHDLLGQSLWGDRLTWNSTSVYEYAAYSPDDRRDDLRSSPWTNILDTDQEVSAPMALDFIKVVPFVDGRVSYFEHRTWGRDGRERLYGAAGTRASAYLSKVYDGVRSEFWDVNRLRHVNTFDVEAAVADTNLPSRDLYDWDEPGSAETKLVRGVDSTDVYRLGWRQRWQTKRGPDQHNVDWITFDLLMTWFSDAHQPRVSPDDDANRNNLTADYSWQLSDTTSLVGDVYYTTNDGYVREANVGLAVTRSPRLSYYIGNRYIRGAPSSLMTVGADYVINSKWRIHFMEAFDLNRQNNNSSSRVELVRRMANWYMTVRVELDPGKDEKIFFLQFEPVGVPELRIGGE